MSTILCDGSDIDEIIDEFGTSITLIDVSRTKASDEYHENSESETEYSVTALVENVSDEEDRVKEGLFQTGDLYVHFKMDEQTYVEIGNYIIYAGNKYKIMTVDKEQRGDVVYITGARCSIYERDVS